MRGRSLHRRLLQSRQLAGFQDGPSVHHNTNGVAVLPSIDEPRHSRQNSRDSNRSFEMRRQQQQPMQVQQQPAQVAPSNTHSPGTVGKNIEIYATLPKKKGKKAAEMLQQQETSNSSRGTLKISSI